MSRKSQSYILTPQCTKRRDQTGLHWTAQLVKPCEQVQPQQSLMFAPFELEIVHQVPELGFPVFDIVYAGPQSWQVVASIDERGGVSISTLG